MSGLLVPAPLPQLRFGDATYDKRLGKPYSLLILYSIYCLVSKGVLGK